MALQLFLFCRILKTALKPIAISSGRGKLENFNICNTLNINEIKIFLKKVENF